ncbi:FHA domain-containing protein, partial [Kribbella antibiotica]
METEFALSMGTQRWPLPAAAEEITLGRAANADVRLPADDGISRIHARLVRTDGVWTLHDASRNGTGLNGRRLTGPTALTPNDQIHIGRAVLTFHASAPATPAPEPVEAHPAPAAS